MHPMAHRAAALLLMFGCCVGATTEPAATTRPLNNALRDLNFEHTNTHDGWQASSLNGASVSVEKDPAAPADHPALLVTVDKITDTDWHAQVFQAGLSIVADHKYNFTFTAKASAPRKIAVFLQEQHSPYKMLSEGHGINLTTGPKTQTIEFTATADSTDGKLTFAVGQATGTITLSDMDLARVGDIDAPQ